MYLTFGKIIIAFDDTEIEKYKFHCHKQSILKDDIDINKIIVSKKVSFGEKSWWNEKEKLSHYV